MKRSKPLEFKRRGNELQHKFNDEVTEKFEEVEGELAKIPVDTLAKGIKSPVSKAKQNLKEGKELLEARQKLIRLADRSEFGWDVVKEYEEDELAEGSDDEKRIQRAEKAAEKKAASKKKRVVSAKRFARPYNRQPAPGFVPAWEPNKPQHALLFTVQPEEEEVYDSLDHATVVVNLVTFEQDAKKSQVTSILYHVVTM